MMLIDEIGSDLSFKICSQLTCLRVIVLFQYSVSVCRVCVVCVRAYVHGVCVSLYATVQGDWQWGKRHGFGRMIFPVTVFLYI